MRGRSHVGVNVRACERACVCYLAPVLLAPVVFVGADVIHQISILILVFITVLSVFQEVKRLQNIWTPGHTEECEHLCVCVHLSSLQCVCVYLSSLQCSAPFISCRFLFSTDPFCSDPVRPSSDRTL